MSRRLRLDTGLNYHVLEWGGERSELRHTVVLVHGFLDLAWGWEPTVRAGLAEQFHIVAPDMRGHGDSDRVGAGGYYHFLDYLADLHSLIEQVGRDRVSLVGHSMGGSVTSYYAGSYPERIYKLALLEGLGPPDVADTAPERVTRWLAMCAQVRDREPSRYPSIADAAARLCRTDRRLAPALARTLAEKGTRSTDEGSVYFKHDPLHLTRGPYPFRVSTAQEFWRAIQCPVLLVEGAESPFRRAAKEIQRRATYFSNARSAMLSDAAHMMQRQQPQALATLLVEFLADTR